MGDDDASELIDAACHVSGIDKPCRRTNYSEQPSSRARTYKAWPSPAPWSPPPPPSRPLSACANRPFNSCDDNDCGILLLYWLIVSGRCEPRTWSISTAVEARRRWRGRRLLGRRGGGEEGQGGLVLCPSSRRGRDTRSPNLDRC